MKEGNSHTEDKKEEPKENTNHSRLNGNNGRERKTVITPNVRFFDLIFRHYLKNRKPKTIKTPFK